MTCHTRLIRNAHLVNAGEICEADMLVRGGRIDKIGIFFGLTAAIINAAPVHLGGQSEKLPPPPPANPCF